MGWGRKGEDMKDLKRSRRFPINLTHFGYGEGEGDGEEAAGSVVDKEGDGEGASDESEPKTFDDLLADSNYQAEFDRRIQKALETQKSKLEVLFDEKATEAEKLAKMNKDEKAEYMRQKQEKELSSREANITKRELMAEAKNTLAEKMLPAGLAEVLNYSDADSCSKSIAAVEKAFQEAVEAGVEERLKGGKAAKKATGQDDSDLAKQVESLMMGTS